MGDLLVKRHVRVEGWEKRGRKITSLIPTMRKDFS